MERRTFLSWIGAGLALSLLPSPSVSARDRPPRRREDAPPPGLARCRTCGEWNGEVSRGEERGKRAHCRCEPSVCPRCKEVVHPRRIGSHYWDDERGDLVHVPVFVGMRHDCPV